MSKAVFIKENYLNAGKFLIYGAGLAELALSNTVISAINLVRSQVVGVYYFAYILFSLLIIFSTLRMSESLKSRLTVAGLGMITLFFSVLTYLEIVRTFVDRMNIVRGGLYALIAGAASLVLGLFIVLFHTGAGLLHAKTAK